MVLTTRGPRRAPGSGAGVLCLVLGRRPQVCTRRTRGQDYDGVPLPRKRGRLHRRSTPLIVVRPPRPGGDSWVARGRARRVRRRLSGPSPHTRGPRGRGGGNRSSRGARASPIGTTCGVETSEESSYSRVTPGPALDPWFSPCTLVRTGTLGGSVLPAPNGRGSGLSFRSVGGRGPAVRPRTVVKRRVVDVM